MRRTKEEEEGTSRGKEESPDMALSSSAENTVDLVKSARFKTQSL
jgi:hypothetical protein